MSDSIATAYQILTDATTTVTSDSLSLGDTSKTAQIKGTTTAGSGAATVVVEVTNNTDWPWLTAATLSLTLGTSATSDGVAITSAWKYIRLRITAISGTGAAVSGSIGV